MDTLEKIEKISLNPGEYCEKIEAIINEDTYLHIVSIWKVDWKNMYKLFINLSYKIDYTEKSRPIDCVWTLEQCVDYAYDELVNRGFIL